MALLKGRIQAPARQGGKDSFSKRKPKKLDTAAQFEKEMKALGITQLPLPPSAVDEQHAELVNEKEEKKKRTSFLNIRSKKNRDRSISIPKVSSCPSPSACQPHTGLAGSRTLAWQAATQWLANFSAKIAHWLGRQLPTGLLTSQPKSPTGLLTSQANLREI